MSITREELIALLRQAAEPLDYVYAMWEGGSAAFQRLDQYSDIDLQFDVDSEQIEKLFTVLEQALRSISQIELSYRLPEPTWHGHSQCFYQLKDAGPYLQLDIVLMKHGSANRFSELELHGRPVVYFDKAGVVKVTCLDPQEHAAFVAQRIAALRSTMRMFSGLVTKELLRDKPLDALHFYNGLVLRSLVELLRIRFCRNRIIFGLRYAAYDLPAEVTARLTLLAFTGSPAQLAQHHAEAVAWFEDVMAQLDAEGSVAEA